MPHPPLRRVKGAPSSPALLSKRQGPPFGRPFGQDRSSSFSGNGNGNKDSGNKNGFPFNSDDNSRSGFKSTSNASSSQGGVDTGGQSSSVSGSSVSPSTGSSSTATSTASAIPSSGNDNSAKVNNGLGVCFGCIPDNDARVLYDGAWTLSLNGFVTSHSTVTPGSTASLAFNGSGIVVFGTVPPSNSTHRPPSASYTIDSSPPFTTSEPQAENFIPFQPLFTASSLSKEEHTIVINITSADTPYILNSFFIFPLAGNFTTEQAVSKSAPPATSATASSGFATPPPGKPSSSSQKAGIIAGVVSALIVLLVIAFILFTIRRRRRRRNIPARNTEKQSRGPFPRETIIFTSTDSIIRGDPSGLWSYYTRSDGPGSTAQASSPPPPLPPKATRQSCPAIGCGNAVHLGT